MKTAGSIRRSGFALGAAVMAGLAALAAGPAWASAYHDIYVFNAPGDGAGPSGNLVMDPQGRIYGTTASGGAYGYGTVFRLTKPSSGQGAWTEEILHSFDMTDGDEPISGVVLGADGSVYGTTAYGGVELGAGLVFKLANVRGWPIKILHYFGNGLKGGVLYEGLVFGPNGLLYGTTNDWAAGDYAETGTVFSVSPLGGPGQYELLHSFGRPNDGIDPVGLTAVPATFFNGFVGTTQGDATETDTGLIYAEQIVPGGKGKETVLYRFQPSISDVKLPVAPPTVGKGELGKALYGTGCYGGAHNVGGAYRLVLNGNGGVTESLIYSFGDQPNDPQDCSGQLVQAANSGTLYAVTAEGGAYGDGAFYELDPPGTAGGAWTEKVDVSFNSHDPIGGGTPGGANPGSAVLRDGAIYYGVLSSTQKGNGAVYELTP